MHKSSALLSTNIEYIYRSRCLLIVSKCQVLQQEQRITGSEDLIGIGTWSFSRSLIYIRLRSVVTQILSLQWQSTLWGIRPGCCPVSARECLYLKTKEQLATWLQWRLLIFKYLTSILNNCILENESMLHKSLLGRQHYGYS